MSPGEKLCDRVLHLSSCAGVPPIVSAHLGQAVAQYKRDTAPDVLFARAVWLGTIGGILAIAGVGGAVHLWRLAPTFARAACLLLAAAAQLVGGALLLVASRWLRRVAR